AAHARLRRLRGHRLVREDPDPNLAPTLKLVCDRAPRRFDLPAVDPCRARRLQPELSEAHFVAAVRLPATVAAVLLSKLLSLGLQHCSLLARHCRRRCD